jgi:hypothetical protein
VQVFGAGQSALLTHWTHWLLDPQRGVSGVFAQLASEVHPTHEFHEVQKRRLGLVQSLSATHSTHCFAGPHARGPGAGQSAEDRHPTQWPTWASHTGVLPLHSALVAQAFMHFFSSHTKPGAQC